jgi:hypothetical protein
MEYTAKVYHLEKEKLHSVRNTSIPKTNKKDVVIREFEIFKL